MSKASTIHDDLLARIQTVLPSHRKLANAYRLEGNPIPDLVQGFAVRVGPAVNTKRHICPKLSIRRQYGVIITRKFYGVDMDTDAKNTTEKQLFEDQLLVIKDLEFNPTLTNSVAANTAFESDSGIQFVNTQDEEFMLLETTFTVEYFENL